MANRASTQRPSVIDELADGQMPDDEDEGQEPDHPAEQEPQEGVVDFVDSPLFIGEDRCLVKITSVNTIAGKDHYITTEVDLRTMPGETFDDLGARVVDHALDLSFATSERYEEIKRAQLQQRQQQAQQQTGGNSRRRS